MLTLIRLLYQKCEENWTTERELCDLCLPQLPPYCLCFVSYPVPLQTHSRARVSRSAQDRKNISLHESALFRLQFVCTPFQFPVYIPLLMFVPAPISYQRASMRDNANMCNLTKQPKTSAYVNILRDNMVQRSKLLTYMLILKILLSLPWTPADSN